MINKKLRDISVLKSCKNKSLEIEVILMEQILFVVVVVKNPIQISIAKNII